MFCLHVHRAAELGLINTMTAVMISGKQSPPSVERVEDSTRQGHSGFEWFRVMPERDLVLGLGSVEIEETDECTLAGVPYVTYLRLTRLVGLRMPESVSVAQHSQAGVVDIVRGV